MSDVIPGLWIEQLPRDVRAEARELIESHKVKVERQNNALVWTIPNMPPIKTALPSFGNTLFHAREAAKMSQIELAKIVNPNAWPRTQGWISRLERGGQTTEVEELTKLCELLDIPFPNEILKRNKDGEVIKYTQPKADVVPPPDWKRYGQAKRERAKKAAMEGHEPEPEPVEPPARVAEPNLKPLEPLGATLPFDRHPDLQKYLGEQSKLLRAVWDAALKVGRTQSSHSDEEWDKLRARIGTLENELVRERELRRAIIDTVDRLRTTT